MKTTWTTITKPNVINDLKTASIKGEAFKTILSFEKAINTAKNKRDTMSWESFCEGCYDYKASKILNKLQDSFSNEWAAYCGVTGACVYALIGDFFA